MSHTMYCLALLGATLSVVSAAEPSARHTTVAIQVDQFLINGELTYKGRAWKGHKIEGLLFNSRMVQGIFDDLNPETVHLGSIPIRESGKPIATPASSSPPCRSGASTACCPFTINFQGGSPQGYSKDNPGTTPHHRGWCAAA